jgi:hypothetical protein
MIHHLLFSDTFFLDALLPIYLIWDSVFGFNFYQPYAEPLPIWLPWDEFPWGVLIFYIYGYGISMLYVSFPIYLIQEVLKDRFDKKNIFRSFAVLALYLVAWEVFLIYFGTYQVIYGLLIDLFPTGFGLLAFLMAIFIVLPLLIFLFALPLFLFAWLYGLYRRRSSISP